MDENDKSSGVFGRIGKFFGFFEDIYFRFTHFEELSKSHKREFDRANGLYFENERLAKEIGSLKERALDLETTVSSIGNEKAYLLDKIAQLEKDKDDFQNHPGYLELLKAKLEVENERNGYKALLESKIALYEQEKNEQKIEHDRHLEEVRAEIGNSREKIDELGRLVSHLKKDKKEVMRFADYIVREKSAEPLIEFLKNSKIPYVLLDPRTERIIDYNPSFAAELGINGGTELRNQSYLSILDGKENKENLRFGLKKFLDTDEKKEFDVGYEKGGKKISLHITKQKPVGIKIDLSFLGKNRETRIVTCVPLVVEKASTWQRYHPQTLEKVMAETEEEIRLKDEAKKELPAITSRLVEYKWGVNGKIKTSDKIVAIIDKMGYTNAYLYFKKIASELDIAEDKKKKLEEEARKAKRKKEARARLKKLDKNPRRLGNIVSRLTKRGIEEEKLNEIIQDQNLGYYEVRSRFAELLRAYKTSLREMEKEQTPD